MAVRAAYRRIEIVQGGTFRQRFRFRRDGTGATVAACVSNNRRSRVLLTFDVEWIDRLTLVGTEPRCVVEIVALPADTALLRESGVWDLLFIPSGEDERRMIYGPAVLTLPSTRVQP